MSDNAVEIVPETPVKTPARLNIASLELRNFMSFGDYVTRLDLSDLGPVLVVGEILSEQDEAGGGDTSNGAGKTSLLTALLWCLFGRTTSLAKPGDKVINWFTKENCYVKIETTDGWVITRTRNVDGHDELIVQQAGEDVTHSTNTNAQKFLNQQFGLDFDIFTASVFCGQMSKSFLESPPVKRKEALERILGLDRLNIIADVVKEKVQKTESEQSVITAKIESLEREVQRITDQIATNESGKNQFESERQDQIASQEASLAETIAERDNIKVPDLAQLRRTWELVDKINSRVEQLKNQMAAGDVRAAALGRDISHWQETCNNHTATPILPDMEALRAAHEEADKQETLIGEIDKAINQLNLKIHLKNGEVAATKTAIDRWMEKAGAECPNCKQGISPEHTADLCAPFRAKLKAQQDELSGLQANLKKLQVKRAKLSVTRPDMSLDEAEAAIEAANRVASQVAKLAGKITAAQSEIASIQSKRSSLADQIKTAMAALNKSKPSMNLDAAEELASRYNGLDKECKRLERAIAALRVQKNPYDGIIAGLQGEVATAQKQLVELNKKRRDLDVVFAHFKYIQKSYSDRRNIKKWLLDGLVPFLNRRIHYYLDAFDIDLHISFTSTLGEETDKWDYELCSGGERKRLDLAIMFGLYDLYLSIYGPQCNLMILDEVDGKLDAKGVRAISDIILNDFAGDGTDRPRPDTILVVSHKSEMKAVFPSQIVIRREDRFSSIASVST